MATVSRTGEDFGADVGSKIEHGQGLAINRIFPTVEAPFNLAVIAAIESVYKFPARMTNVVEFCPAATVTEAGTVSDGVSSETVTTVLAATALESKSVQVADAPGPIGFG